MADRLLDELERDFRVLRTQGPEVDPALLGESRSARVVRLIPTDVHGAPLTVMFSDCPGLWVRFGRWYVGTFPNCGCDYCDESPAELAELFSELVQDLVAGRFSERCDRRSDLPVGQVRGANGMDFSSRGGNRTGDKAATDIPRPPKSGRAPWAHRLPT